MALNSHRYQSCLQAVRERARAVTRQWAPLSRKEGEGGVGEWAVGEGGGERSVTEEEWKSLKLHIVSSNSFPTAAGLASSAAGFACLGTFPPSPHSFPTHLSHSLVGLVPLTLLTLLSLTLLTRFSLTSRSLHCW